MSGPSIVTTTSEELDELRAVTRAFLQREVPAVDLRSNAPEGYAYHEASWVAMAQTLGLQGLLIPEQLGGLGLGVHELAVVCEELGRALYNGPFLSSAVVATSLLAHAGEEGHDELRSLATGELIATLVSPLSPSATRNPTFTGHAVNETDVQLSGREPYVIGGAEAGLLLVPVSTATGIEIIGVDAKAAGVRVTRLESLDLLRPIASVEFDQAIGRRLIDTKGSVEALDRAGQFAQISLAAESIGAAERALEMTVEYVNQRVQFARVIGSFQAVKHRCAQMLLRLESAKSALFATLGANEDSAAIQRRLAALAKVTAADSFAYVAGETVHLHGGIGFTWEHPAHLFYRRAKANQLIWGTRSEHQRAIFQSLLPTYQQEGNS